MNTSIERPVLYPPSKTPRGWYIVYQPAYRSPNVFNLHERGMFINRPAVQKDCGARIVTSEDLLTAVQYMSLVDETAEDPITGNRFSCINKHGLVFLTDKGELDTAELKKKGLEERVESEIRKVFDEWFSAHVPEKGSKADMEELNKVLKTAIGRGKATLREWLISSNISWIHPFLPKMIQDFKYGFHQRITDTLYTDYRQRGGEETEKELIKKINLFIRIYESEGLIKPCGASWLSDDELWDCWVAFSGSESEAMRVCSTIENVIIPLREKLTEQLDMQE